MLVKRIGEELSKRGENEVLGDFFLKMTRQKLEREMRKPLRKNQAEMEFIKV